MGESRGVGNAGTLNWVLEKEKEGQCAFSIMSQEKSVGGGDVGEGDKARTCFLSDTHTLGSSAMHIYKPSIKSFTSADG